MIDIGCENDKDFETTGDLLMSQYHRRFLNPDGTVYWKSGHGTFECEPDQVGWRFVYVYE